MTFTTDTFKKGIEDLDSLKREENWESEMGLPPAKDEVEQAWRDNVAPWDRDKIIPW